MPDASQLALPFAALAVAAGYAALETSRYASRRSGGPAGLPWLVVSTATMAVSTWCTHFVGIALLHPVDGRVTPGAVGSAVGLAALIVLFAAVVAARCNGRAAAPLVCGALLGGALSGLHGTGLAGARLVFGTAGDGRIGALATVAAVAMALVSLALVLRVRASSVARAEALAAAAAASRARDASDARLHQIAAYMGEVFYVAECDGARLLFASPAYERVWGEPVTATNVAPRAQVDRIHPDDRARVQASLARVLAGEPTEETYRIVRRDGTVRWVRDRSYPVPPADEGPAQVVGIAEDVTTEREAEERLARLHAQARGARRRADRRAGGGEPGARGAEPPRAGGEPAEERVPRQHEPRAAHAAERDRRRWCDGVPRPRGSPAGIDARLADAHAQTRECPRGMLAHEWLLVIARTHEYLDVVRRADVAEHHGRVALQPAQFRALHRRALEGAAELRLRHLQDVAGGVDVCPCPQRFRAAPMPAPSAPPRSERSKGSRSGRCAGIPILRSRFRPVGEPCVGQRLSGADPSGSRPPRGAQVLDQRPQRRRGVPALRVVEVVPWEWLAELLRHRYQLAAPRFLADLVLVGDGETETSRANRMLTAESVETTRPRAAATISGPAFAPPLARGSVNTHLCGGASDWGAS